MKIFISYKHHGEDDEELKAFLLPLISKFNELGSDAYCNLFDEELAKKSVLYKPGRDYVLDAFNILDSKELLFVLLMSEEKSEGMLMEVGYAIAKGVPVVVAVRNDIKNTYLPTMGNLVIKWNDLEDLLNKIQAINLIKS